MTQKEKVLAYIRKYGCITPILAIQDLDITRLAARVFELRADGHNIVDCNKHGTYAEYRLIPVVVTHEPIHQVTDFLLRQIAA